MKSMTVPASLDKAKARHQKMKLVRRNWDLYLLIFPTVLFFLLFKYWPMYGIQIAFRDFVPVDGIWGSPWVGQELKATGG